MASTSTNAFSPASADLVPFVPRLTLEWLRDEPAASWREVEGTVAFIDISGFTAMSERLSGLGRAGAEEVTEVMNATFAALLGVAYAQGGGLIKFGGDALLLLYDGEEHARRAARAAFEMRRTLRAIGRPRTSAGAIQLKMHAGLHSGRFQFFLVGESHRELLIAGPAATRTVEMEGTSEAGEILVSAETASVLDADALGEEKGNGRLLRSAPEVRGSVAPLPAIEGIPLEVAVPAPLRAQLLEIGPLEGEHRHAAVAFIRFAGTDEIIETEGPEAAADALVGLVRAVQTAADEHRVTFLESDIDRDGGRIILVSGAPQTFGDDEERMLRTVRAVVDGGLPLPIHVGVSEGRVFTGQVGASFRRTYTVLGDTAALAARLMARAGEDEIWVSAGAVTRGGGSFEATELEPLSLKGKAEPVQAFVLGELLATPERPEPSAAQDELPFVDRERERAVLGASVAPVRMGFGTLVELVGEPGIGKSRLALELRENCADMRQISLRCEQYETSTPYYAFRPFLRSLLDVELNGGGDHNRAVLTERLEQIDLELVPWAPLLAAPLDVEVASTPEVDDLDPSFWRARLHGVMGTLLGHLLDSPTLFVFDDVHWMDDASSELLRYLGTQLPTKPWLACTTRRPGDDGFAAATGTPPLPALTLRLEALPEEDAKALAVAAAGDRRLTDDEVAALLERAAGNPLFLRELASVGEKTEDAEDLPDTVEALVATRIDQLSPGDRALLRWASVLGERFSGALIADVLEDDSSVAAASEAWDRLREFVERDPDVPGGFRFRHALIRDAAYEGLSYRRRRELHARVAEVIERRQTDSVEDVAELLSLHYFYGERWTEACRYSRLAGEQARQQYANADAARFYERAIAANGRLAKAERVDEAALWSVLGDLKDTIGDYEGALDALRSATRLLKGDPVSKARTHKDRALVCFRMGAYEQALRETTAGQQTLAEVGSAESEKIEAELIALRSGVKFQQGRVHEAIALAEKAVQLAESSDAPLALASAYVNLDDAYARVGTPEKAVFLPRALEIYKDLGMVRQAAVMEMNLGVRAYADGRWDDAVAHYRRARADLVRVGDAGHSALASANLGEVLVSRGALSDAEEVLADARETLRALHFLGPALWTEIQIGRLLLARGESRVAFDESIRICAEALEIHETALVVEASILQAEAAVRLGEPSTALELLASADRARANEIESLTPALRRLRAITLLELERAHDAATELVTALQEAQRQHLLYDELLILRTRQEVRLRVEGESDPEESLRATHLQRLLGIEP
jgi:class 3 adenylate cyclase/tetratricopeptide (TPR) repeat protein